MRNETRWVRSWLTKVGSAAVTGALLLACGGSGGGQGVLLPEAASPQTSGALGANAAQASTVNAGGKVVEGQGTVTVPKFTFAPTLSGEQLEAQKDVFQPVAVHEWGTFTSVQASDGTDLEGLHHEEEPLPPFVHGRDGMCFGNNKCMEHIPQGVTQKMETPVIYFHGSATRPLSVRVDFPKGVISQWYPQAESYGPAKYEIGERVSGGTMTWKVALAPKGFAPPKVSSGDIWAPSRNVPSAPLRAQGEDESFIFYRGLGSFSLPVRVTSSKDGSVTLANGGALRIPAAFLLKVDETGGGIVSLGDVSASGKAVAQANVPTKDMDSFLADAKLQIKTALVQSGLTEEESLAMVDTWSVSYFHTPGLRVLYVLPRLWTDIILPMHLDFVPTQIVRTLIGRIEVTTQAEEKALLTVLETAHAQGVMDWELPTIPEIQRLGRHVEPKLRAVRRLVTEPKLAMWLDSAIQGFVLEM